MQYITADMGLGEALGLLDLLSSEVVTSRRSMQTGTSVDISDLHRKLKSLLWLLQSTFDCLFVLPRRICLSIRTLHHMHARATAASSAPRRW